MKQKLLDLLLDFFRVLLTPECWLQNHAYSAVWDKSLNELMAHHKFKRQGYWVATIGGVGVWISNHPYASFTMMLPESPRPSRATILRAHDKMIKDFLEDAQ